MVRVRGSEVNTVRSDHDRTETYTGASPRMVVLYGLGICAATILVYVPALFNDFVNWDDRLYITGNPHIQALNPSALYWMLTTAHAGNWHPLTWLIHALVYSLGGDNPRMHHGINVLVHGFNAALVFYLTLYLLVWVREHRAPAGACPAGSSGLHACLVGAVSAAALFALHPLRVESVAWAAELKDVLCAFFSLLSILCYLQHASGTRGTHQRAWFGACLLSFVLALMAKPMAVMLPAIFLLLDVYPLRRVGAHASAFRPVFLEKMPFLLLSCLSVTVTVWAQKTGGALRNLEEIYLLGRILNALKSSVFYLQQTVWPAQLVPLYRLPEIISLDRHYIFPGAVMAAITGLCVWSALRNKPLWLAVYMYYIISLLPVIGIIQIGVQAAADRYTYLPCLSISLLAGAGVAWLWDRAAAGSAARLVRGAVVLGLLTISILMAGLTRAQIAVWRSSETLWQAVIRAFPNTVPDAYYGLGLYYYEHNRLDEALAALSTARTLNPAYAAARHVLGNTYIKQGLYAAAITELREAVRLDPKNTEAYINLGSCYAQQGLLDKARDVLQQALVREPHNDTARINLGLIYHKQGLLDEAIIQYRKALDLHEHAARAHYHVARAYFAKKRYDQARGHCSRALQLGFPVPASFIKQLERAHIKPET